MKKIENILDYNKIHFIGIGGISMQAIAKYLIQNKITISGSDIEENKFTSSLKQLGAKIFIGHKETNITSDVELVIYNSAINSSNVELIYALNKKIQCIERSYALWLIALNYKNLIAISGTHGKTTTTSLISKFFIDSKKMPEIHIGGENDFQSQYSKKDFFICEACEYHKSFLELKTITCGIILNIENDHLDYYKSFKNLSDAFKTFAKNCQTLITSYELNERYKFNANTIYTISLTNPKANFYAEKIDDVNIKFNVYAFQKLLGTFESNLIGDFNIYNILCAIAVGYIFNLKTTTMKKSLKGFFGVKRRNEILYKSPNFLIVTDYAHHPTELNVTIDAYLKKSNKLIVIFQPHTYSRTKILLNDFVKVLSNPNFDVVLYPTYPAREKKECGLDATELYKVIKSKKSNTYLYKTFRLRHKLQNSNEQIIILFLGAGTINKVAEKFVKEVIKKDCNIYVDK